MHTHSSASGHMYLYHDTAKLHLEEIAHPVFIDGHLVGTRRSREAPLRACPRRFVASRRWHPVGGPVSVGCSEERPSALPWQHEQGGGGAVLVVPAGEARGGSLAACGDDLARKSVVK